MMTTNKKLTYTNRKGTLYYFREVTGKRGVRIVCSQKMSKDDLDAIPDTHEITETPNGQVSCRKKMKSDFLLTEVEIAKELGDREMLGTVTGNIGLLYGVQSKFEEAKKCFYQQYNIAQELGDKEGLCIVLGNIGTIELEELRYSDAKKSFDRQLKLALEIGDKHMVCTAKGNIGSIELALGNYDEADRLFQQQLRIAEEIGDKIETRTIELACELFNAEGANVQPHSGTQANMAVMLAVLKPQDTILAMDLACGGHLSHGHPLNFSGKFYNIVPYGVDRNSEYIDYQEVADLAQKHKPKICLLKLFDNFLLLPKRIPN